MRILIDLNINNGTRDKAIAAIHRAMDTYATEADGDGTCFLHGCNGSDYEIAADFDELDND